MPRSRRLLPDADQVIVYRQQCFAFFTLEHMETTRAWKAKPRRRALAKARPLMQDDLGRDAKPDRT